MMVGTESPSYQEAVEVEAAHRLEEGEAVEEAVDRHQAFPVVLLEEEEEVAAAAAEVVEEEEEEEGEVGEVVGAAVRL